MIPYLLAIAGGYLIGSSTEKKLFANGGMTEMAEGGEIARTILQQLGGAGRLTAMTGAYNFIDRGNGLSFKIKNQRANYIKITLNGKDLYDVEVGRIRGNTYKVVKQGNDLYFDQLKPFIEEATGMYLSLYKKGGETKKRTKFVDKVDAIADRLDGTKVPKKLQKDYGKRYNREEAEEAGRRIAGAQLRDLKN